MIRNHFEIQRAFKATRDRRKTSIRTMASETGISRTALDALASGSTSRISFDVLDTLCQYFECEVGDILKYIPEENDEPKQ